MAWPEQIFRWLGYGTYKTSPTAVSDGQSAPLLTDAYGRLQVAVASSSSTSYTTYKHSGVLHKAVVKASAGTIRQITVTNTDTVDSWVAILNLATLPSVEADALTIWQIVKVPAKDSVSLTFAADVSFTTGLTFVGFTTSDLDTESADKLKVVILYT